MIFRSGLVTCQPKLDFIPNKLYNFAVINCTKLFRQKRGQISSLAGKTEQSLCCKAVPAGQMRKSVREGAWVFRETNLWCNVQHYKEQQPYGIWYSQVVQ